MDHRLAVVVTLVVVLQACTKDERTPAPQKVPAVSPVSATPPSAPAPVAPPEQLRIEQLAVPNDLHALVLRGPHERRLAMVYLHGMCVYPGYYVESFMNTAAARGDLVAVQGTGSCGGDGFLHTWESDVGAIDRRIEAAFAAAGIELPREVVLIGYSQGADRAEALVARYPAKYRSVVLIASSTPPSPARLRSVRAAVLMAGTRDSQGHMREGLAALQRAHVRATFIPMPDAWHGHMGTEPESTMAKALDFLEAAP